MAADSLTLNAGCGGANLAVDNICEACTVRAYQYVKHTFGPDGTATLVTACAGLPVDVKNCTLAVTDNCGSLTVDNSNLCTIAGAIKCEDAVHSTGDAGVMALGVRRDVPLSLAGTDGDYAPFQLGSNGALLSHDIVLDAVIGTVGSAAPCNVFVIGANDACGNVRQPLLLNTANDGQANTQIALLTTTRLFGYNGTTWDRVRVDGCDNLQVNINAALPAGTNAIGKLASNSGVDIGDVDILSIAAGTNAIGDVGIEPRTSGGLCVFRSIDLDETEEAVKASAGQLFSIMAFNLSCAVRYLKVYNGTVCTVVVGGCCATTPIMTVPIPAHACSKGAGFIWSCPIGLEFGTAITVAATTGIADNDTGAPGANEVVTNIGYK